MDHIPGRFVLFAVGITPVPEAEAAVDAAIHSLTEALEPWRSGRDYINFRDVPATPDRFYSHEVLERLGEIQERYDPRRIVRPNQQWAA